MAMNRQTKRMLQRQGQLDAEGQPSARKRPAPQQPRSEAREGRTGPIQFVREVRGELRKVAWPTRSEVRNYSIIVLVAVVILTAYISSLDFAFGEVIFELFER
ncbi:MAG TPA: preprotein translocase subunit SecE [Acidimicrobiales bacterium]|nr:preprotein translocase subunit SecE [Acidimicrobiales bacterium]